MDELEGDKKMSKWSINPYECIYAPYSNFWYRCWVEDFLVHFDKLPCLAPPVWRMHNEQKRH